MRGDSSTNCSSAFKDFLSLHQLSARSELELISLKRKARSCSCFIMNSKIMRVVLQGEAFAVQSQKSENGQVFQDILLTDFYKFN